MFFLKKRKARKAAQQLMRQYALQFNESANDREALKILCENTLSSRVQDVSWVDTAFSIRYMKRSIQLKYPLIAKELDINMHHSFLKNENSCYIAHFDDEGNCISWNKERWKKHEKDFFASPDIWERCGTDPNKYGYGGYAENHTFSQIAYLSLIYSARIEMKEMLERINKLCPTITITVN